jgi:fluoride exporter
VSPGLFVLVALAGGVGAALRYLIDVVGQKALGGRLPWGVLAVNLSGAFALGILSGGVVNATGLWVLGVGLLGGYTTFSSVAVSTVLLAEEGRARAAAAYGLGTFAGSVALAAGGMALAMLAR